MATMAIIFLLIMFLLKMLDHRPRWLWSFLIIIILIFPFNNSTKRTNIDHIIQQCQNDCQNRIMNLFQEQVDMTCNGICKISLCQAGCYNWYQSTCIQDCQNRWKSLTMQTSIGGTFQDNYCAVGCNHGHSLHDQYIETIFDKIGVQLTPRLVTNSLTNDSLSIQWNVTSLDRDLIDNITYKIQWRYAEQSDIISHWFDVSQPGSPVCLKSDPSLMSKGFGQLANLNAYTSYQFRIVLNGIVDSWNEGIIYSKESEKIKTLAYGTPSSACIILNCMAISWQQVSVNWRAPQFPNGPIIAYSLYLVNTKTRHRTVKDIHIYCRHDSENSAIHNYVFNQLDSHTEYNLSIVTHNNFGEGPRCHCMVKTSASNQILSQNNQEDPFKDQTHEDHFKLYLASSKSISRKNIQFLLEEDILYHVTDYVHNAQITGLAVHVAKRYLFVGDTSGTIRRILLKENSVNQVMRIINGVSGFQPSEPSNICIDWLNDRLYWLQDSVQIMRSNLDGESIQSIYLNWLQPASQTLTHFQVDPYNGYLFWLQFNDLTNRSALYRLDLYYVEEYLNDATSSTSALIKLRSRMELIYQSNSLIWTMAVSYENYRLWLAMSHTMAIHSITMDGNDETTIRDKANMEQSPFDNIANMAIYNQRLYFTKGSNICWEEYHPDEQSYYHNTYNTESNLIALAIMDNKSQPMPVPLAPVTAVQALFLDTSAKIYWHKPDLLAGSGRGAWQNWRYEVAIQQIEPDHQNGSSSTIHLAEVNNITQCDAVELRPDTLYSIRVRAFTWAGKGAWSVKFIGSTLPSFSEMSSPPYVLVATNHSLISIELDGKFKQKFFLSDQQSPFSINVIEQHGQLMVVNSGDHIHLHNQSNGRIHSIVNNSNAQSVSVEWMAGKVYWSNPSERMICRCNLDGSQMEILPIMSYAQQLAIDSLKGHLYWSTSSSLYVSLLNGLIYSQKSFYSTEQIRWLSIDPDHRKLYWLTVQRTTWNDPLDTEPKVILHGMKLFDSIEKVSQLTKNDARMDTLIISQPPSTNLIGPIAQWANRFWWLDNHNGKIMVSDDGVTRFATVPQLTNVKTFQLVIPSQQHKFDYKVVPDAVQPNSIRIIGTWQNCSIVWDPVQNVNYGQIYFEVTVHINGTYNAQWSVIVNNSISLPLNHNLKPKKPYSAIGIGIRAFTHWASARQVTVVRHTPASIPSQPRHVRVFTWTRQSQQWQKPDDSWLIGEARWWPPANPNGVIQGYTISLWAVNQTNQQHVSSIVNHVISNQNSYKMMSLKPNCTYYLQVRAATEVGEGPPSKVIQFKTDHSKMPMRLLLAQSDSIIQLDLDSMAVQKMSSPSAPLSMPYAIDYSIVENRIYFVQDGNMIKSIPLDSTQKEPTSTLHCQLEHSITSLTNDWLSRRLYISTIDLMTNRSAIWYHEIDSKKTALLTNIQNGYIHTLRVDPYQSILIWTEQLWYIKKEYVHADPLFTIRQCSLKPNGTHCNIEDHKCKLWGNIDGAFVLIPADQPTVNDQPYLIYFDKIGKTFIECTNRCSCVRVSSIIETERAPIHMEIDIQNDILYWTNSSSGFNGQLYCTDLRHNSKQGTKNIESIKAIRSMVRLNEQNLPCTLDCFTPGTYLDKLNMSLASRTPNSLRLNIHLKYLSENDHLCCYQRGSLAPVRFQIEYCNLCESSLCSTLTTYNQTILLDNLKPYCNYTFNIQMDNYYQQLLANRTRHELEITPNASLVKSGPFVFATGLGPPAQPANLRAIVQSPETILIQWDKSEIEQFEQPEVIYELRSYWLDLYSPKGHLQKINQSNMDQDDGCKGQTSQHCIQLEKVCPGQKYNVSLRALYATINNQAQQQQSPWITIQVKSYDPPPTLVLKSIWPRAMHLQLNLSDLTKYNMIESHQVWYQSKDPSKWMLLPTEHDENQPNEVYDYHLKQLKPYTSYQFHVVYTYSSKLKYKWPKDNIEFVTNMSVPDGPDKIKIIQHGQQVYDVIWDAVESNSDSAVYYQLFKCQLLQTKPSCSIKTDWTLVYNGTETHWIVSKIKQGVQYNFRLYAANQLGVNELQWAQTEQPFWIGHDNLYGALGPPPLITSTEQSSYMFVLMFVLMSILAILLIIFSLYSIRFYKLHSKQTESNRAMLGSTSSSSPIHQIELTPWQQLPHPHLTNALYANSNATQINDIDLSEIPVFDWKSFTLVKLLGKGAFGEVYEALLNKTHQRIALKFINKTSKDSEDSMNFLKEAKFMWTFKHDHILDMMGVCLNHSSSIIIVMELMEAGDLLRYLRSNRAQMKQHNQSSSPGLWCSSTLTMDDLMSICIDVAKGCQYLQEKQFIHRDLAARNCLVSSTDPSKRIVKIADFGLTRGLYHQDYYRKEGGLMPIRWMSPESLTDGVFTTQSDVWSFSIIMYEVMTLGQQPYQAYSNKEVLDFVKSGGILERPTFCPPALYSLMKQCWSYEKEQRPSFTTILEELISLREQLQDQLVQLINNNNIHQHDDQKHTMTVVHNQNYQPTLCMDEDDQDQHPCYLNGRLECSTIPRPTMYCATSTTVTSLHSFLTCSSCSSECAHHRTMVPTMVLGQQTTIDLIPQQKNYLNIMNQNGNTMNTIYLNAQPQQQQLQDNTIEDINYKI